MDRQTWLEWRRRGIGSSDAPVIMGVSPWKTLYELWDEKVNGYGEQKDNANMQYGREMEGSALEFFENVQHVSMWPQNIVHHELDWMRGSFDGLEIDGNIAVEIKHPKWEDHKCLIDGNVPEKYYPQCQHLIKVKELGGIYYMSGFKNKRGEMDYKWKFVERDEQYIGAYMIKASEFWESVEKKIPPEKSDRDVNIIENPKWKDLCFRRSYIKSEIEDLEEILKEINEELIQLSEGRSAKGFGFLYQKSQCKGSIDYEFLKKDHPEIDLDKYRKPSYEKWTMRKT